METTTATRKEQSDSRTPDFPSRRSLDAKIRRYSIAAHNRGDHGVTPSSVCPECKKLS